MLARTLVVATALLSPFALYAQAGRAEPAKAEQPAAPETRGRIADVTVYRGQALITRLVPVAGGGGGGGLREIIVTDLPDAIAPASLYAEPGPGMEVRSVRYRVRPVMQDVREEVRKLDDAIAAVDDRIHASERQGEVVKWNHEYLMKLEAFTAPAATAELTKGVLNAETLERLSTFLAAQHAKLAGESLAVEADLKALRAQRELLDRERQQISGRSARSVREAVILVNVPDAAGKAAGDLRVRYLVDNATWSPSYTIRGDSAAGKVAVEYFGAIQQTSGEDWSDVSMTLSTATPSLVARGPKISPMTISLAPLAQAQAEMPAAAYASAKEELRVQQKLVEGERARKFAGQSADRPGGKRDEDDNFDASLNTLADKSQLLDILTRTPVTRTGSLGGAAAAPVGEEGYSVTYTLPARTTLPSRSDRQQVQIAALTMPGEFYKVATPVLTGFVYDEAGVTNSSGQVLLAGPVSTYVAGRFVGSGELPTVAAGEKFTVGLGIDSSLRASRELVEKTESLQGGNRVIDLTYRLVIENFGAGAAKIRLVDRLPMVAGTEVRLTLTSPGQDLSTDAEYVKTEKKNGILRWDVQAAAQSDGLASLGLEYKFRLEHDRQMTLAGMAGGR